MIGCSDDATPTPTGTAGQSTGGSAAGMTNSAGQSAGGSSAGATTGGAGSGTGGAAAGAATGGGGAGGAAAGAGGTGGAAGGMGGTGGKGGAGGSGGTAGGTGGAGGGGGSGGGSAAPMCANDDDPANMMAATCDTYCTEFIANCGPGVDASPQKAFYTDKAACVADCTGGFKTKQTGTVDAGARLCCEAYHARNAKTMNDLSHCTHAVGQGPCAGK
jgi:hypothetical protein